MAEWLLEIYLFPAKKKPPCSLTAYIHNYLGRYLPMTMSYPVRSLSARGAQAGKPERGTLARYYRR